MIAARRGGLEKSFLLAVTADPYLQPPQSFRMLVHRPTALKNLRSIAAMGDYCHGGHRLRADRSCPEKMRRFSRRASALSP